MAQMTVQVVTPDGLKYDHHASFIHAVTKDGQIGILPGHINLIAPLEVDELKVRRVDDESHVDWIAVPLPSSLTRTLGKQPLLSNCSILEERFVRQVL